MKDNMVGMVHAEIVTGYVGQILDECEVDGHAIQLLQKLYDIAKKSLMERYEEEIL